MSIIKSKSATTESMGLTDADRQGVQALVDRLESQTENINRETTNKLALARQRALSQRIDTRASSVWPLTKGWSAVAASTAVVFLVAASLITMSRDQLQQIPVAESLALEDATILGASDSIEFFESMEFLLWLESNSG